VSAEERGQSYRDYLQDGESLHRSILDICEQMERTGWICVKRDRRGFRYWCPCAKQHNVYIDTAPITEERLEFLLNRTCLTFN